MIRIVRLEKNEESMTETIQSNENGLEQFFRVLAGLFLALIGCLSFFGSFHFITHSKSPFSWRDVMFVFVLAPFGLLTLALSVGYLRRLADVSRPLLPEWAMLVTGLWMLLVGGFFVVQMLLDRTLHASYFEAKAMGSVLGLGFLLVLIGWKTLKRIHRK